MTQSGDAEPRSTLPKVIQDCRGSGVGASPLGSDPKELPFICYLSCEVFLEGTSRAPRDSFSAHTGVPSLAQVRVLSQHWQ